MLGYGQKIILTFSHSLLAQLNVEHPNKHSFTSSQGHYHGTNYRSVYPGRQSLSSCKCRGSYQDLAGSIFPTNIPELLNAMYFYETLKSDRVYLISGFQFVHPCIKIHETLF